MRNKRKLPHSPISRLLPRYTDPSGKCVVNEGCSFFSGILPVVKTSVYNYNAFAWIGLMIGAGTSILKRIGIRIINGDESAFI